MKFKDLPNHKWFYFADSPKYLRYKNDNFSYSNWHDSYAIFPANREAIVIEAIYDKYEQAYFPKP